MKASLMSINLVSLYTIVHREVVRILRIWPQTILPAVITTALYFLIFGQIIGQRVGNMEGTPFMEYIVPGLIVMGIINNAYTNTSSSFFSSKFQKNIEELLVSPTSSWVIILGFSAGGVLRGMIVGVMIYLVSLCFTLTPITHPIFTFAVGILTATLFAFAGLINGLFARKFDDISIIPTFVLTPLIYLGGVFYNVELLPDFWQNVTLLNPIFYMVNAFRYGMLHQTDINMTMAVSVIFMMVSFLYLLLLYLFKRGYGLKP